MGTEGMGVLVGMDESACSEQALAWAAADAVARRVPLTVAGVVDLPRLADVPLSRELVSTAELAVRRRVDAAVARSRDLTGDMPVHGRVLTGDPAAELLQLAAGAEEVVVGSHGTGQFGRLLIGSVGGRVAEHAPCPAVVVRGERTDGRVVVGLDTSPHSEPALEYGFGYADAHGVPLVALHVYTIGAFAYPIAPYPVPPYPVMQEMAPHPDRSPPDRRAQPGEVDGEVPGRRRPRRGRAGPGGARSWSTPAGPPACSSSAPAGTAAWPGCCSAR